MKTRRLSLGAVILAAVTGLSLCATGFASATTGVGAPSPAVPAVQAGAAPTLSPGVSEVMKLFKAGLPVDVMTNYINNANVPFYLSADDIIYLQQQGVPNQVISTIIQRDGVLRRQAALAYQQAQASGAANNAASQQVQVPAQAPAPTYYPYAASEPAYDYSYPGYYDYYYYDYPYYYWPPVYWGFGLGGFGHGGGYYRGGQVGGYGGIGHVGGGFGGGTHVGGGGFGGGGHVGGGGHIGGGFGGGGHGGGGRH